MKISPEEVRVMAEAFNLMMDGQYNGVEGRQLVPVGGVVQRFQDLITRLVQEVKDEEGAADEIE